MKWVTMWGNAQSTVMPQAAKYAKDLTLRYPLFVPFDGDKIRITLDNYCINENVKISKVYIGRGNKLSDNVTDLKEVTFKGKRSVNIKAHKDVVSDEIEYSIKDGEYLVVTIYLEDYCNLTGGVDITGPLSKGWYAYGDQSEANSFDINTSKSTTWVYFLSNVDIYTDDKNQAVVCYGDSITSQDWPDYMLLSLRDMGIKNVSVVRKAVSGTRILRQYECITYQSYGLCGKNRFMHEVSSVSGASKLIIQHGINDIIHPVGEEVNIFRPMSDLPTWDELAEGIMYYIDCANEMNLDTYVGTLLPIYNWRTYAPFREEIKNDFNNWIKDTLKSIDFETEIGNEENNVWHFKDGCDSGDHLHPSKEAYKKMGMLAAKRLFVER